MVTAAKGARGRGWLSLANAKNLMTILTENAVLCKLATKTDFACHVLLWWDAAYIQHFEEKSLSKHF